MTGYDKKKKEVGRRRATVAELQCDYCSLTYGTAPCTASVGVTGPQKCFNTRKTCQDPANYNPQPKSYFFSDQPLLLPPQGQMIIVAGQGEEFAVSFDGEIYVLPPAPPVTLHFMACGVNPSNELSTSNDASVWVSDTSPLGLHIPIFALNFCNGFWMIGEAVGNPVGPDAAISPDGVTWTPITVPFTGTTTTYQGFLYALGQYFVWGANPAQYCTSSNATTWTIRTPPMAANFRWLETDGSQVVCVGEQSPDNSSFYYSGDGISWTTGTTTGGRINFAVRKIVHAAGLFVGVGHSGSSNEGVIYTSVDGHAWTYRSNPWNTIDGLASVAYGNSVWCATAPHPGVMTSPDAITWTVHTGPSASLKDITFYSGLFYGLGDDNFIYTSSDGVTWTAGAPHNVPACYRIAVRP